MLNHSDERVLSEPGSTSTWQIDCSMDTHSSGYRYVRIQQNGKNASGQTHYLSLSGFEIYGQVILKIFFVFFFFQSNQNLISLLYNCFQNIRSLGYVKI